VGDVIDVVSRYNDDWYKGRIGEEIGYFSRNYVQGMENVTITAKSEDSSKSKKNEGDWQDAEYFESYANVAVHLETPQDERTPQDDLSKG